MRTIAPPLSSASKKNAHLPLSLPPPPSRTSLFCSDYLFKVRRSRRHAPGWDWKGAQKRPTRRARFFLFVKREKTHAPLKKTKTKTAPAHRRLGRRQVVPAAPLRRRHLHGVVHLDDRRGLCESDEFLISLIVFFFRQRPTTRWLSPLCLRFPFASAPFLAFFPLSASVRGSRMRGSQRAQRHSNSKKSAERGGKGRKRCLFFAFFFSIAQRRKKKKTAAVLFALLSLVPTAAFPPLKKTRAENPDRRARRQGREAPDREFD